MHQGSLSRIEVGDPRAIKGTATKLVGRRLRSSLGDHVYSRFQIHWPRVNAWTWRRKRTLFDSRSTRFWTSSCVWTVLVEIKRVAPATLMLVYSICIWYVFLLVRVCSQIRRLVEAGTNLHMISNTSTVFLFATWTFYLRVVYAPHFWVSLWL